MQMIADTAYYKMEVDVVKNRIYTIIKQQWDDVEISAEKINHTLDAIALLSEGFTVVGDWSAITNTLSQTMLDYINSVIPLLGGSDTKIAGIKEDGAFDNPDQIGTENKQVFSDLASAEDWLDV